MARSRLVRGGSGVGRIGDAALELGRVDPLREEVGRHVLVGHLDEARFAAGDALLNAWRLYLHFRVTEEATVADAERLAEACSIQFGGDEYRIAAHSLGARLVLEAMPLLPPSHRPAEVHLCAAAVTPSRSHCVTTHFSPSSTGQPECSVCQSSMTSRCDGPRKWK